MKILSYCYHGCAPWRPHRTAWNIGILEIWNVLFWWGLLLYGYGYDYGGVKGMVRVFAKTVCFKTGDGLE